MKTLPYKLTSIYISALLLVFPLWTGFEGYADITRAKFALYAALTLAWAAGAVISALIGRVRPKIDLPFALAVLLTLLWALFSYLASPFSPSPMGWRYDGIAMYALYAITALGVMGYGVIHKYYVNLLAISVTLCSLVAVLQLCGFNPLWLYPNGWDYYGAGVWYSGSFLGTIGNTNLLGAFMSLACPLLGFSAIEGRGPRLWLLLPAALGALVTALARSEAGLVGIGVSALIYIPYYVYQRNRKAARALIICLACCLLAALAALRLWDPGAGTLHEAHEILCGRVEDSFGSSRVAIWREGARLFSERPLLGGGPGSFGLRSTLEFSRYAPESGLTFTTRADNAHSSILSLLVDAGAPGALFALAAAGVSLRRRGFSPGGASLAAYFAQSLFSTGTVFTLPLAMALMAVRREEG